MIAFFAVIGGVVLLGALLALAFSMRPSAVRIRASLAHVFTLSVDIEARREFE